MALSWTSNSAWCRFIRSTCTAQAGARSMSGPHRRSILALVVGVERHSRAGRAARDHLGMRGVALGHAAHEIGSLPEPALYMRWMSAMPLASQISDRRARRVGGRGVAGISTPSTDAAEVSGARAPAEEPPEIRRIAGSAAVCTNSGSSRAGGRICAREPRTGSDQPELVPRPDALVGFPLPLCAQGPYRDPSDRRIAAVCTDSGWSRAGCGIWASGPPSGPISLS